MRPRVTSLFRSLGVRVQIFPACLYQFIFAPNGSRSQTAQQQFLRIRIFLAMLWELNSAQQYQQAIGDRTREVISLPSSK